MTGLYNAHFDAHLPVLVSLVRLSFAPTSYIGIRFLYRPSSRIEAPKLKHELPITQLPFYFSSFSVNISADCGDH